MNKHHPRKEAEILALIRQVQSPIWHDSAWWKHGERGSILLRLSELGSVTRDVWLRTSFHDPEQAKLAVWTFTAEGNRELDEKLSVCANLPRNGTYQLLANLVVEYAQSRGWGDELAKDMTADIREAQTTQLFERLGVQND